MNPLGTHEIIFGEECTLRIKKTHSSLTLEQLGHLVEAGQGYIRELEAKSTALKLIRDNTELHVLMGVLPTTLNSLNALKRDDDLAEEFKMHLEGPIRTISNMIERIQGEPSKYPLKKEEEAFHAGLAKLKREDVQQILTETYANALTHLDELNNEIRNYSEGAEAISEALFSIEDLTQFCSIDDQATEFRTKLEALK